MKERLSEPKRPVRWYLLEELPRTSRGKVNRAAVGRSCEALEPIDLVALLRRAS